MELAEEDDGQMEAIKLWLRIDDVKKLKGKYKDNEAIEFSFDLNKDIPEDVAQEMVNIIFFFFKHCSCIKFIAEFVMLIAKLFIVCLRYRLSLVMCVMVTTRPLQRLSRTECL